MVSCNDGIQKLILEGCRKENQKYSSKNIFGNTKNDYNWHYQISQGFSLLYWRKRPEGAHTMKPRTKPLGTQNLIGARVTEARKKRNMLQITLLEQLQLKGISISSPALSLLEGQRRPVSDFELLALSEILHVSVSWLLGIED